MGLDAQLAADPLAVKKEGDEPAYRWSWVGHSWQCTTCLRGRRSRTSVEFLGGVSSPALRFQ
eukprot:4676212-Pyramimonas_sp.AAC.1